VEKECENCGDFITTYTYLMNDKLCYECSCKRSMRLKNTKGGATIATAKN
jgi:hypothetical protein